ncbi:ankyrin repeat and SAM domain-containing protein 6 [Caerostris darwini]|uniref:Ankyrin repeat and SAM domain-containing protein 6 n=1 Tax=Caerostris darwini TaxID=1538125 RepID=A0AAV4P5Q9_9ARAC|nr:ankyrin repeat and SAM domain-containing protein 6 [Caerostris darwini]
MQSNNDILYFCQTGNLAEVEKLLLEGVCVDFQNNEGESPLQVSAANGFSQIVSLLISYGASVDLPNSYGWTPLMHAARHGHSHTVALLLKRKAKVNICNKLGLSPIIAAAWSGDLKTLKLLIEAGAIMDHMLSLNQNTECDLSPMMAAAFCGYEDIVRFLFEEGANVDQNSPVTGLSPLMLAASEGQKKILEIIIENGSDIYKTDICGKSALDLAISCCKQEIVLFLESIMALKNVNENLELNDVYQAVKSGDILKVKSVLKQNSDSINSFSSNDGMTPLMLASMLGYNNIINVLISNGAKLDAQDFENGWTALMYAVFHRRSQTVELLIKKGASVEMHAANGFTALDLARHLDSSDTTIIENLTSKFLAVSFSPRKSSMNSTSDSLDRRKLSGTEKFLSKRNETQTGLKSWIGGVAQHLQQKMLTRLSPRYSEKYSISDTLVLDDTIVNEVFEGPKSPIEETEVEKLHPSVLLSPDKFLAKELKEHKFEAIKPPLPPLEYYNPINMSSKKRDKNAKPVKNWLHVPHLLKDYNRKSLLAYSNVSVLNKNDIPHERKDNESNIKTSTISDLEKDTVSQSTQHIASGKETSDIDLHTGKLTTLLKKEQLQKYVEKFREHEVDVDTLQCLTKEDLTDIGVQSSGSQKKLLDVINKLQNKK